MCSCSTKGQASLVIGGRGRGYRRGGGQRKRQELRLPGTEVARGTGKCNMW